MSRLSKIRGVRRAAALASFTLTACWLSSSAAAQFTILATTDYNGAGSGDDYARGIVVDGSGNVTVAGEDISAALDADWRIRRYDTGLSTVLASTKYDDPAHVGENAFCITLDAGGNALVAGDGPGNGGDWLAMKYTSTLQSLLGSTTYSGPGSQYDYAMATTIDHSGNVIIAGWERNLAGKFDWRIRKYNSTLTALLGSTSYDGPGGGDDDLNAVAVDSADNIIAGGSEDVGGLNHNWRIRKYNPSLTSLIATTDYTSSANPTDEIYALAIDASDRIIAAGNEWGGVGGVNWRIRKYDPNLSTLLATTTFNDAAGGSDYAYALTLDGAGHIIVAGFENYGAGGDNWRVSAYDSNMTSLLSTTDYNGPNNGADRAYAIATDGTGDVFVFGEETGLTGGLNWRIRKYGPITDSPPAAPTSLVFNVPTNTRIDLVWPSAVAGTFPISAYQVLQRFNCTVCAPTQTFTTTLTGYSDFSVGALGRYYYEVKAIDTQGNVGSPSPMISALMGPAMTAWEESTPATSNAGDYVDYKISFSNTADTSGWAITVTTEQGSFQNRKKANAPPGQFWVEGGFGGTFSPSWATSLGGPWFSGTNTGLTEPLYLRWVIGMVGLHKSGYIRYGTTVQPSCSAPPMVAGANIAGSSGFPTFQYSATAYCSTTTFWGSPAVSALIDVTSFPGVVAPGDTVTHTVNWSISDGGGLTSLVIMDTLPAYSQYVPGSANIAPDFGWDPNPGPPSTLRWSVSNPLGTAASGTITFQTTVDWGNGEAFEPGSGDVAAPQGTLLTNRAGLTWDNGSACLPAEASTSLPVDWFDFSTSITGAGDGDLIYSLTVRNRSTSKTWWDVELWNVAPSALTTWGANRGFDDPCLGWTMTPGGCSTDDPMWFPAGADTWLTWTLPGLPPGATATVHWKAGLSPSIASCTVVDNAPSVWAVGRTTIVDGTGSSSNSDYALTSTILCPSASAPPGAPDPLTAIGQLGSIALIWSPATPGSNAISEYEIWRSTCGTCPAGLLATRPLSVTAFNDYSAPVGMSSIYTLRAIDTAGVPGPFSLAASAMPLAIDDCAPLAFWSDYFTEQAGTCSCGWAGCRSVTTDTLGNIFGAGGGAQRPWIVRKYDPSGSIEWTASDTGGEAMAAVATSNGEVVVAGANPGWTVRRYGAGGNEIWSVVDSGLPRAAALATGDETIVAGISGIASSWTLRRYTSGGANLWNVYESGTPYTVAVDPAGNIVAAGEDGAVTRWAVRKYDSGGTPAWTLTDTGIARSLAVDGSGNVIVAGWIVSASTEEDWLIRKYDPAGVLLWSRTFDSPASRADFLFAIASNAAGDIWAAGSELRPDISGPFPAPQNADVMRRLDPSGTLCWSHTGIGGDAMTLDGSGNVILAGSSGWFEWSGWFVNKYSPMGCCVVGPVVAPDAPGALSAAGVVGEIGLQWSPATPGSSPLFNYQIWRASCGGCSGGMLTTVPATATTYRDAAVIADVIYEYRIRVMDNANQVSAFSPYAQAAAMAIPPPPPAPGPALAWSRSFSGPAGRQDLANAAARDACENLIVVGDEYMTGQNFNMLIRKYDPAGALLWSRSYSSPSGSIDHAFGVAIDAAGNALVAGSENLSMGQADDWRLRLYDPNGTLTWSRSYLSPTFGYDIARAVTTDASGNFVVVGRSDVDWILRSYDIAGNVLWSRTWNGGAGAGAEANAIARDSAGNLLVAGYEVGIPAGDHNWAIRKYDSSGALIWSRTRGGSAAISFDEARGVAVDLSGNAYVAGFYDRSDISQGPDWVVAKYDSSGTLQWTRTVESNGSFSIRAYPVDVDSTGHVLVAGTSSSPQDWLMRRYDPNGNIDWSSTYDGDWHMNDGASSVVAAGGDAFYVAGYSYDLFEYENWVVRRYGTTPPPVCGPVIPPASPAMLTALGQADSISLDWSFAAPGSYPVSSYEIWRASCPACAMSWLATVDAGTTWYDDAGVTGALTYQYQVRAVDDTGATGPFSLIASAQLSASPSPAQSVSWNRRYAGPGATGDWVDAIAEDLCGNVYIGGIDQGSGQGLWRIIKYDSAGNTLWTDTAGDTRGEATGLATDAQGNLYAAGRVDVIAGSRWYAMLRKYAPGGTLLWSRTYQSAPTQSSIFWKVAVDSTGQAIVGGSDVRTDLGQSYDWIVRKYDTDGGVVWTRGFNAAANLNDECYTVAVDASDNILAGGYENHGGVEDGNWRLHKYDAAGTLLWSRTYNQPGTGTDDRIDAVTADAAGNIYAAGHVLGSSWPDYDWMVRKYDASGNVQWTRFHATPGEDACRAIAIRGDGTIIVGGYESIFGDSAWLAIAYSPTGGQIWALPLDDPNGYGGKLMGLAADACGNLYTAGYDWTLTGGNAMVLQKYGNGSYTACICGGTPPPTPPAAPATFTCSGGSGVVHLDWAVAVPATLPVSGYEIWRGTCSGCPMLLVGSAHAGATWYDDIAVTAGETYVYAVRATDIAGLVSPFSPTDSAIPAGVVLPVAPATLACTGQPGGVGLVWDPVTPGTYPLATYEIWRATCGACTMSFLTTVDPAATVYLDGGASYSSTSYYTVRAVDGIGHPGPFSPVAFALPTQEPPAAPFGLTARPLPGGIELSWFLGPCGCVHQGYEIWRATCSCSPTLLTSVGSSATGYVDFYLTAGSTFEYFVRGVNTDGVPGTFGATGVVSPGPGTPPPAPVSLTATPGVEQITLTWTPALPCGCVLSAYEIWRATCGGCPKSLFIVVGPSVTIYVDVFLTAGVPYEYSVRAINSDGTGGGFSGDGTAVPAPGPVAISLSKTVTPANPAPGTPATYRLVVTNTGSGPVDTLTLTDTVPAELTAVTTAQPAGFAAPAVFQAPSGTLYVWTASGLGLAPGARLTFTITGVVGMLPGPTAVCNTARAAAATGPDSAAATSPTVCFSATPTAQLVCSGGLSATLFAIGGWYTVTLTVSCSGTAHCTNVGPTCMATGPCTLIAGPAPVPLLQPGDITVFTWTFSCSGAGAIAFTASCTGTEGWSGRTIGCVPTNGPLPPCSGALQANPSCTVSIVGGGCHAGHPCTVRCHVINLGGYACDASSATLYIDGDVFIVTTIHGPDPTGPLRVDPGSSTDFDFTFTPTGTGDLCFSLSVTAAGVNGDPVLGLATLCVGVTEPAAITLVKEQVGGGAVGAPLTWRLVLTNTGGVTFSNVTITDTVSPVAIIGSTAQPAGFTAPVVTSVASGTRYLWSNGGLSFQPGTSLTFTITGIVGGVCAPTAVSNTAWAAALSLTDAASATTAQSNEVGFTVAVPTVDFSVVKTQTPANPGIGEPVQYQIQVTNTGGAAIDNLTVTDTLSPVIQVTGTTQPGFGVPTVTNVASGTRYVWSATGLNLAPAGSLTITLNGVMGLVCVPTSVTNTTFVDGGTACLQVNHFSNAAGTVIQPATAGLTLVNTQSPASPTSGAAVTYALVVTNTGSATLTGVTVCDTLSPVVTAAVPTTPAGFSPPVVTSVAGTGTRYVWTAIAPLLPGTSATFQLAGTVGAVCASTSVSNTAYVSGRSPCSSVQASGAATGFTLPAPIVDFSVVKTQTPANPGIGESIQYQIQITNTGGAVIDNLTITDTLSPVVQVTGTTQPGFGAPTVTNVVYGTRYVWSATGLNLAPAGSLTITINGLIGVVCGPTAVANTAYVDGGTACVQTGHFSNAVGTMIQPATESLALVNTQSPAAPAAGAAVTYTLVVTNTGSATLTGVTVTDTLSPIVTAVVPATPAGFSAPVVTSVAGTGTRYVWTATAPLLPGVSATFQLAGTAGDSCVQATVSNTAFAAGSGACTGVSASGIASGFTLTGPTLAYTARVEQSPAAPAPGGQITYRVIVTNTGTALLSDVTVVDTVASVIGGLATDRPAGFAAPAVATVSGGVRHVWSATGLSLATGASLTFTVTGLVGTVTADTTLTNVATVTAGNGCAIIPAATNVVTASLKAPVIPTEPIDAGKVKIVGGIRGYINPKRGETSTMLIRPTGPGEIHVRIYDQDGVLIWQVTQSTSGGHTDVVQWRGVDLSGRDVSPGLYPIIIEAPGIVYRDTLVVVR